REIYYTPDDGVSSDIFRLYVREEEANPFIEQVTRPERDNYAPAWDYAARQITFLSTRQTDPDVYVMDVDGGNARLLTRDDDGAEDRHPQFSPDGRYVAFVSNRLDDRFQVYLIAVQ